MSVASQSAVQCASLQRLTWFDFGLTALAVVRKVRVEYLPSALVVSSLTLQVCPWVFVDQFQAANFLADL